LQALIDAPAVRPHIAIVASDNPAALSLRRAEDAGIPTAVVGWNDFGDRDAFSSALADVLEENGAKGVVLAGFMRILAPKFLDRFHERVLNIHPSLLPAYPGSHAVENALDDGAETTGATVHFVDEKVDHGPIVEQVAVPVESGDTTASLHARIQVEEHRLYPRVVEAFVSGRLFIEDGEVRWL
jgi:phosphoribosylglycinamide formyltransferase 1